MLKGALALVLRQVLLVFAGMLASAGIITATVDLGYYCFDTRFVADATATALMLFLGGVPRPAQACSGGSGPRKAAASPDRWNDIGRAAPHSPPDQVGATTNQLPPRKRATRHRPLQSARELP